MPEKGINCHGTEYNDRFYIIGTRQTKIWQYNPSLDAYRGVFDITKVRARNALFSATRGLYVLESYDKKEDEKNELT
jgi:hypothetical protein